MCLYVHNSQTKTYKTTQLETALMGNLIIRAMDNLMGKTEKRILMLGLDAAGKTTVLYKLQLGEALTTIPTIGFNVERVQYKNIEFTMWDVGGQDKIRTLWKHYFHGTDALIYVVDSNDRDRLEQAQLELHRLLQDPELRDMGAVLVFANKQDLPNSMSADEVMQKLKISEGTRQLDWYVQGCCARNGDGLYEGLDWLANTLKKQQR